MRKVVLAVARAAAIIGSVTALAIGVTLAIDANAPHATLTSNTVTAASADLQVGVDANSLGTSIPGFQFLKMAPGQNSAAYHFTLHNAGSVALVVTAAIPTDLTGSTLNPSLVCLQIDNDSNAGNIVTTVADMVASNQFLPNGTFTPGETKSFTLRATLSRDLTGRGPFTLVPFDMVFTGTSP